MYQLWAILGMLAWTATLRALERLDLDLIKCKLCDLALCMKPIVAVVCLPVGASIISGCMRVPALHTCSNTPQKLHSAAGHLLTNHVSACPAGPKGLQQYIDTVRQGKGQNPKQYSARYICSLVGDFHRTLLYGGEWPSSDLRPSLTAAGRASGSGKD
jgi:hypothetical protein